MLGHDYGFKRIMSSYYFQDTDQVLNNQQKSCFKSSNMIVVLAGSTWWSSCFVPKCLRQRLDLWAQVETFPFDFDWKDNWVETKIKDNYHKFSSSPSSSSPSSRSSYSGGAASWTWPSLRTKLLVSRSPIGTWVTFFDNFSKRNMLYHPGFWHNSWICARKRWLPRSRRSRQGVQHRPPGKQSHPWRGIAINSFFITAIISILHRTASTAT